MARKLSTDLTLLAVTVALLGFGLLMVWSSSSALAQERYGSPYYFLVRQAVWSVIGLAAMVAALLAVSYFPGLSLWLPRDVLGLIP